MVCFNVNQIYLHFSADCKIVIEGEYTHKKSKSDSKIVSTIPARTSELMQLLQHRIVEASCVKGETLVLGFDNGHILEFAGGDPNFESYRIEIEGKVIVV